MLLLFAPALGSFLVVVMVWILQLDKIQREHVSLLLFLFTSINMFHQKINYFTVCQTRETRHGILNQGDSISMKLWYLKELNTSQQIQCHLWCNSDNIQDSEFEEVDNANIQDLILTLVR